MAAVDQGIQSEGATSGAGDRRISLFFAGLLVCFGAYFIYWGLGYTGHHQVAVFVLATIFGLFMAFNIGGNDVANSFGTSVGAGTLTMKQALVVAAIFEVSGAMLAGGNVTDTIRSGIVDLTALPIQPIQFAYIMMSALVAAALWLLFATRRGYPVSTTHSIVGGIIGSSITLGIMTAGTDAALHLVQWREVGRIAISWVLSPLLGGILSYTVYSYIKHRILDYNDRAQAQLDAIREERGEAKRRHKRAFETLSEIQRIAYAGALARDAFDDHDGDAVAADDLETDYYRDMRAFRERQARVGAHRALEVEVPMIAAIGAMIITGMILFKSLESLHLGLSTLQNLLIMLMVAAAVWMATFIVAKTLKTGPLGQSTFVLFSWLQVFTASGFAFSHGSNDIANAIGPFIAILDVLRDGAIEGQAPIPPVAMLSFGVALIAGLWFIGRDVIRTVGHNLTKIHPASGFSAELSAAAMVMVASALGLPVSSTHILIGAVLGIGLVNRRTNWGLMKPIALAWVITLPAAAILSAMAFIVLSQVLG